MFFWRTPSISMDEFMRVSDGQVVDVREPYEFKSGHVPKAQNIPLGKITSVSSDRFKSKVYVICESGMRSRWATRVLRQKGIDAINVKGGMYAYWKRRDRS